MPTKDKKMKLRLVRVLRRSAVTPLWLFTVMSFAPIADAQMKQWTDEQGVVHYGNDPRSQDSRGANEAAPGQTIRRIDRTHFGFSLGDEVSAFRATKKGLSLGSDKDGFESFLVFPNFRPSGSTKMTVMFIDGRLALMEITYPEHFLGGWEKAIADQEQKYGAPRKNGVSMLWTDGPTGLSLKKDYLGNVIAGLGDREAVKRWTDRSNQGPKF